MWVIASVASGRLVLPWVTTVYTDRRAAVKEFQQACRAQQHSFYPDLQVFALTPTNGPIEE